MLSCLEITHWVRSRISRCSHFLAATVFSFSSVGVTTPEGQPVQRTGLAPDIEVYPTIEGIKEGRDELMEAAVDYILSQNEK